MKVGDPPPLAPLAEVSDEGKLTPTTPSSSVSGAMLASYAHATITPTLMSLCTRYNMSVTVSLCTRYIVSGTMSLCTRSDGSGTNPAHRPHI
eukprot:3881169-Rhodomonas_salina.2